MVWGVSMDRGQTLAQRFEIGFSGNLMALSRVWYRTPRLQGYGSRTGLLDTDSRGPVPDSEPRL